MKEYILEYEGNRKLVILHRWREPPSHEAIQQVINASHYLIGDTTEQDFHLTIEERFSLDEWYKETKHEGQR